MTSAAMANYLNEQQRERRLDELAARASADVITFGASVEGRPLRAAVVKHARADAPVVFINGNIHGLEWIANLCALGVLDAIADDAHPLRQSATVIIAPCLNPDGAMKTESARGDGTLKALRTNANGVDLNRNFARPDRNDGEQWASSRLPLAMTGSTDARRATYRGPHPFSEPEARSVDALLAHHKPHAVVSFHSFMGTLIPPKVTTLRESLTYRRLCRAYRRGQTHFYAPTFMWAGVDVFTGELEDRAHHVHGAWALTVETFPIWRSFAQHLIAPSLFARFNPHDPARIVDDAVAGATAYALAAITTPHPRRPSTQRPT